MEELVVPLVILVVLGAIVWFGMRSGGGDPQARWKAYADTHGLEHRATGAGLTDLTVWGSVEGVQIRLEGKTHGAARGSMPGALLTALLPHDVGGDLVLKRRVSVSDVGARAALPNAHAADLERIWEASGASEATLAALRADPACDQRLTNLIIAYPHAEVREGAVRLDELGDFGERLENTVLLAALLAGDLARVIQATDRGSPRGP